jgi:hypothetical protein
VQCGVHGEITLRTIDTMWHAMYVYGTFFAFATVHSDSARKQFKAK